MFLVDSITDDPFELHAKGSLPGISHAAYTKAAQALSYVLGYSHDGEYTPGLSDLRHAFIQIESSHPNLARELATQFPHRIYIDRKEEELLINEITEDELILVRARVGEGKSCLMRRIVWDYLRDPDKKYFISTDGKSPQEVKVVPIYLNLMHLIEPLNATNAASINVEASFANMTQDNSYLFDSGFRISFEKHFKSAVLETILRVLTATPYGKGFDKQAWLAARIIHSDTDMSLRNAIEINSGEFPYDITTMLKYLDDPQIRERMGRMNIVSSMEAFFDLCIHQSWLLVIFIDNLDRYPIHLQQQVLTISLDWAARKTAKVVLAIRERNFRRIEETVIGAQKVGTVILDPLVEATGEPDAALGEEEERETLNTTILSMVQKRIELLREFGSDLLPKKLVAEGEQPARATSQPFLDQFLTQYQQVLWGMLGTGYYHLSNHCLRTLLPLIGHQVFRVLFGPEADYYQSIAPDPAQQSDAGLRGGEKQTKRNSFYYKMMLTPDRCVPRFDQRIPNVFHSGYNRLRSMELVLLEYLMQSEKLDPRATQHSYRQDRAVRVVLSNLIRCGYDMRELNEALDHLAGDAYGYGVTGFIERLTEVVPGQHIDFPVLERYYAVLPAGLYFVNRLINTCEYAFWAAVNTPIISDEIRTKIFSGKKSYKAIVADDEFKLLIVTRFLEHYLLPKVEARKLRALDGMSDGATWDNYIELTCLHGVPYPIRLIKSLRNWVRYTSMDPGKQVEFERKLDALSNSFLAAFRMVLPGSESLPASEQQLEGMA